MEYGPDQLSTERNEPNPPETPRLADSAGGPRPRGWQRVVLFLLTFLGLNILVGVGYVAIRLILEPGLLADPAGLTRIRETDLVALLLVIEPLTVLLVVFFRRVVDHAPVRTLGVAIGPGWVRRAATGALHATGVMAVLAAVIFASAPEISWTREPAGIFLVRLVSFLALFAAVGFTEEIVMRGYILRNLLLDMNARAAVALSAFIFAIFHAANPGFEPLAMANIFLVGVYLALVALKEGSLWYPIGFHFAWNFLLGFVLSLPVSGVPVEGAVVIERDGSPSIFSGGNFGPEASVVCSALLIFLVLRALRTFEVRPAPVADAPLPRAPETWP